MAFYSRCAVVGSDLFRKGLFFLLLLAGLAENSLAQTDKMNIRAQVYDTSGQLPVRGAVGMAIRFSDSLLVRFDRSDSTGLLELLEIPLDTYIVIISSPGYGDRPIFIMGSAQKKDVFLEKVQLPTPTVSLQEFVVVGYTDPVYYKGDTLVFLADSFKTRPNAVVEDLLKKLPGIRVDEKGKIYSQGKAIDQLLVDGDEFFGSDPTIATRNLSAQSVQSVKVYEKKEAGAGTDGTVQVMNLELKEDAKKGYFGKIEAGTDVIKFHESQILANRFSKSRKFSVFALYSNTPKGGFGWDDREEYGLNDLSDFEFNEDQNMWIGEQDRTNKGLPSTLKTGFYYSDKLFKNTKYNLTYLYNPGALTSRSQVRNQYFFTDTSYSTSDSSESDEEYKKHRVVLGIKNELDSFITIELRSKINYNYSESITHRRQDFFTADAQAVRRLDHLNTQNKEILSSNNELMFERRFRKQKRWMEFGLSNQSGQNSSDGYLNIHNEYYPSAGSMGDSTDQHKLTSNNSRQYKISGMYNHPITDKFLVFLHYSYLFRDQSLDRYTFELLNGEYSQANDSFITRLDQHRQQHRLSMSLIYEKKKFRFSFGSAGEDRRVENLNLRNEQVWKQRVLLLLPFVNYNYTFKNNSRVFSSYTTNSILPSMEQIQPAPDNSNNNQVYIGNPDLKPSFAHNLRLSYNFFKAVSGRSMWVNINGSYYGRGFSNSTEYDSLGLAHVQTVNVSGNYFMNGSLHSSYSYFDKKLMLGPSIDLRQNSNLNYINKQENKVINSSLGTSLYIYLSLDSLEFSINGSMQYSQPTSSLSAVPDHPYFTYTYEAWVKWLLPKGFEIETDASWYINTRRAEGYNVQYVIWNAAFSKKFLKKENLILGLSAVDMLDQNLDLQRSVQDNVISDSRTNAVSRYVLFRLTYKFTSPNPSADEPTP